jgi:excisionase family DNA binding protein
MNRKKLQQKTEKSKKETVNSLLLVSLSEAGRLLGVSARTIRRMSQEGKLPQIVKVGGSARISWQGIQDYYDSLYSIERGCTA